MCGGGSLAFLKLVLSYLTRGELALVRPVCWMEAVRKLVWDIAHRLCCLHVQCFSLVELYL